MQEQVPVQAQSQPPAPRRVRWPLIIGGVLLLLVSTVVITLWLVWMWLFPAPLKPVYLNAEEARVLDDKLARLGVGDALWSRAIRDPATGAEEALEPMPYREDPAARTVQLSQREVNALLARTPDLAQKVALHLGRDTVSANIRMPIPEGFPILGGQNLRIQGGIGLRHVRGRVVVVLEGISLMGVSLPVAWLGGIKGQDLIAMYGDQDGFWRKLADGIEELRVEDGQLTVRLAP